LAGEVVTVLDITNAKRPERALAESEERFKSIYEESNDALMLLSEKGFSTVTRSLKCSVLIARKNSRVCIRRKFPHLINRTAKESSSRAGAYRGGAQNRSTRFEWVHRRTNGEDFPAEVLISAFT